MNSVRPNNLSLKYQRFTSSDCKDIGIRPFEFVPVPLRLITDIWNIWAHSKINILKNQSLIKSKMRMCSDQRNYGKFFILHSMCLFVFISVKVRMNRVKIKFNVSIITSS